METIKSDREGAQRGFGRNQGRMRREGAKALSAALGRNQDRTPNTGDPAPLLVAAM
jgi:hypothetical protein